MKHIIIFLKLPLKTKFIFTEAFVVLGISRFMIVRMEFKRIAKYFGKAKHETDYSYDGINLMKVKQISKAIKTMSKYTPWESKCLVQALSAKFMLNRRKQKSTVYLGFGKENDRMIAHAWVRCGNLFITGGDGSRNFTIIGKFS